MTIRFSTRAPSADYLGFEASPGAIVAAAKKADEVGFDASFVNDHIIVGDDARSAPWTYVYDPFVAISFIAAHTTRVGVGVSVPIMPYRNPITTAQALATLERMSGGRVIAGIGPAGIRPSSPPSVGHSMSAALAPMNTCAFGRPAGRKASCRSPADSCRSPTCMSLQSQFNRHQFGSVVPARRRFAVRHASRCGSRRQCPSFS